MTNDTQNTLQTYCTMCESITDSTILDISSTHTYLACTDCECIKEPLPHEPLQSGPETVGAEQAEDHAEDLAPVGDSPEPRGLKFDSGKPDWTLLPWLGLAPVVNVLEFGAVKYERDNWQLVDNAEQRYQAACFRHLIAIINGEEIDPESGLPHTAHLACNSLFLSHFQQEKSNEEN